MKQDKIKLLEGLLIVLEWARGYVTGARPDFAVLGKQMPERAKIIRMFEEAVYSVRDKLILPEEEPDAMESAEDMKDEA